MDSSTTPFYDRSLVNATLDSGFDSCTASGNISNTINQSEDLITITATDNVIDPNTIISNECTNEPEIESPDSTTTDDNFKTNHKKNRTSSADSGSTFEIIDNSPPSPTSYQLVEDSPVSGIETSIGHRNFPKLDLHIAYTSSSGVPASNQQTDNRYLNCGQSSIKTCEVNQDEERDTFSPINRSCNYVNEQFANEIIYNLPSTSNNTARCAISSSSSSSQHNDNIINVIDKDICNSNDNIHNLSLPIESPLNLSIDNTNCSNTIQSLSNVNNISGSNSASGSSNHSDLDNKTVEKKKLKSTSTKEEKQRQNEEIVIMETSSVSSETGSWESVFPHHGAQTSNVIATGNNYIEVKDISSEKFTCVDNGAENHQNLILPNSQSQAVTASCPVSACFIDAASLLDESEVNNIVYPPKLPETGCFGPKPLITTKISLSNQQSSHPSSHSNKIINSSLSLSRQNLEMDASGTSSETAEKDSPEDNSQKSGFNESSNSENWKKKLKLDKLETFHKSFELCKAKPIDVKHSHNRNSEDRDSNSSSCSSDSPAVNDETVQQNEENTHNLSDEEKLWKRENSKKSRVRIEVKDQFNKESPSDPKINTRLFANEEPLDFGDNSNKKQNLSKRDSGVCEVNEPEIVKIRKEQERKQGNLVFQHNIPQFSGHYINPKSAPVSNIPLSNSKLVCNFNDSSNFSEYSSSPVPSLHWSDNECSTGRLTNYESSSAYGDTSDFGETSSTFNNSHANLDSGAPSVAYILPDTPHNSIVQIGNSTKVIKETTLNSENLENRHSQAIKIQKKTRCDDSAPIVSGGASIKDFTPKQCESPPVRRKTDTCPIVSGGFISLDFQRDDDELENNRTTKTAREKPKNKQTWIVDMSDCLTNGKRRRSTSSSSSTENTTRSVQSSIERNNSGNSQRSGLGFYVSLNDIEPPKSIDSDYSSGTTGGGSENVSRKLSRSLYDSAKRATGFYVDLSESENSRNATPPPSQIETSNSTPKSSNSDTEKKNIFSMFIDLGEKKLLNKKGPFSLASRLSSSLLQRKQDDTVKVKENSPPINQENQNLHYEKNDSLGEAIVETSIDNNQKPSLLLNRNENACAVSESLSIQLKKEAVIQRTPLYLKDDVKRHSWNNSEVTSNTVNHIRNEHKEHKRSSSLSTDTNDKNIMNILDKIPFLSKTSSMSIDSSLSPFDDIECSKTDLSSFSNNSATSNSGGENEFNNKTTFLKQQKKRRRDVKINETFDKSSQGSITDGILSKDISPCSNTTDTDDLTFQQDDNLLNIHESPVSSSIHSPVIQNVCPLKDIGRPTIMETIIETKETSSPKKSVLKSDTEKHTSAHTMETLHATIEKQKMLLETVNENPETHEAGAFVRLSDLDKPIAPIKFELHSPESAMSKSVGNQRHINRLFQETTRNRPHSWAMTRSTGNSIMNITNSVENLRSLSRLFPHLSKEFSNSLPNDVCSEKSVNQIPSANLNSTSLMYQQKSPSDLDFINSTEMSTAESSLASSFSRSALDESSISCRQPRRLGEDLLKMFLQEIGTDVIVEVNGRRIKAHKCILRSRCQYFAAMLAGGWVQSAGNVISLQGYSYSSVHFALCHIYSGACHPPDGISLMELAALADLLGLEGLKEVTAHALKSNYCHNFHKPCSGCIDGILQVLPVALNHALDDLYRKCLKWTCRHYLKVWPTRSFAQLPSEIFNRCRQQVVAHLTSETVLQSILDCDQLIAQIAHFRWALIIENLLRDILDAAYVYISDHFSSLIASDSFLSLGNDRSSDISKLENLLLRTASSLNPDQACRSYQRVTRLNSVLAAKVIKMPANLSDNKSLNKTSSHEFENVSGNSGTEEEMEWNVEFIRLVSAILSAVEQCLTRQCSRAMRVSAWQRMDLELRKKIQKLACLTEPLELRRNTGLGNMVSKQHYSSKQISYSSGSRNQDLYQVKLAIQAHSKRALEQDKQLYRATTHTQTHTQDRNTQTIEKTTSFSANQSDSNRNSTGGKLSKSSTRSQVPQSITVSQKLKPSVQEKSTNGHRRTMSADSSNSTMSNIVVLRQHETSLKASSHRPTSLTTTRPTSLPNARPTSLTNRLTDIRPRYLEPRKSRINSSAGPTKNQNSNNLQVKNKNMSSSESSRNSSPAFSRKIQTAASRKIGTKSINMSLDSLASPSKKSNKPKTNIQIENEISVDSLADSLKSSIITEKTVSHESLRSGNRQISRSNPGINKEHIQQNIVNSQNKKPLNLMLATRLTKPKVISNGTSMGTGTGFQNTSGSSPSSITNKSSRLSSVSSTGFSPRDAFKNRSISVPATSVNIKKSFLSAKSREILARKAANLEKAKQTQENIKTDSTEFRPIQEGQNKLNGINKCNSSSNIPTRLKTTNLPLSILLNKKTPNLKYQQNFANINSLKNSQQSKTNNNVQKVNEVNSKIILEKNKNMIGVGMKKSGKYINDNKEQKIEIIVVDNAEDLKYESKLERSSTFCKESSDLPVTELEIVE